jgi:alcohol dehydrogenase class IV
VRFELATAGRIVFGAGALREAGGIAKDLGRRALIVTGSTPERAQPLLTLLCEQRVDVLTFAVTSEPDIEAIRAGAALAREEWCDCVIGFGGGAALDTAKAIAVLLTNQGDVLDYLEIIGDGKSLTEAPVPLMAIPTTAGTGSEVTHNSVITSPEHRLKVSLRSPLMVPKVALVDPELTYDLSLELTAATGMDALSQLIEPFVSTRANPLTDGLCQEGLVRVARSLRKAVENGLDAEAREDMAVASLFGGLALASAGLGAVHGLAGPLGGMVSAPHGALCAALLPEVVAANLRAVRARAPHSDALPRFGKMARLLSRNPGANAEDLATWLRRLVFELSIPRLSAYGVGPEHLDELLEKAAAASSMKANPIKLTRDELRSVIKAAL